MMFGKEPAVILGALSEVIRAIIPTLIIFGIINWTDVQTAQVMLLVGVSVGFFNVLLTRSQVRPESDVNALIKEAVKSKAGTTVNEVKAAVEAKE
jgi:hypothetical protein